MMRFLEEVCALLDRGEELVLATILSQSGSTPRASGALMAVRREEGLVGTIGGGVVEGEALRESRELLASPGWMLVRAYDLAEVALADADAASGMICGGALQVLLAKVSPADGPAFAAALTALRAGKSCALTAWADSEPGGLRPRWGQLAAGSPAEGGPTSPALVALAREAARDRAPRALEDSSGRGLAIPLTDAGVVVIAGAGHVARHAAALAGLAGFRVVVLDDRAAFANRARFPLADEVLVVDSFEDCFKDVAPNTETYYVILTRGHAYDKQVLAQALRRPTAYVGMIGSRRKREATYAALRQEGFAQAALEAVHCPIGLNIGAETPEEIAICIVAELIQERARRCKT